MRMPGISGSTVDEAGVERLHVEGVAELDRERHAGHAVGGVRATAVDDAQRSEGAGPIRRRLGARERSFTRRRAGPDRDREVGVDGERLRRAERDRAVGQRVAVRRTRRVVGVDLGSRGETEPDPLACSLERDRVEHGSGSTRWSKTATKTGSSGRLSDSPTNAVTRGAGVENVHATASASVAPLAAVVPAGTSTRYSVAAGRRSVSPGITSKRNVRVPIQRHRPSIAGVIETGTSDWSSCASVSSGTIG